MTRRTISLTEQLYDYILSTSLREPELLRRLRDEMAPAQYGEMAEAPVSPDQGQFMALLVKLIGAKRRLEVGVFG
jgi:predicted O-methyltransferase YrrM